MIESNEATTTEVTVDPNAAITTAPETNVTTDPVAVTAAPETNVTADPTVVTAAPETNVTTDPAVTSTTDLPPVATTDDPNPTDELKSIYKQIDNVNEKLNNIIAERDAFIKQRDQLLANSDVCGSVKQESNRLLGKLVPYTNGYANFIQLIQNNLNNIEVSAKVDPEFFSSLTSFAENYEPNDEEVAKIVSNLGGITSNRTGYSSLSTLVGFNNSVKNSARLNADVGSEYNRNVVPAVKPSRPVPVVS